MAPRLNLENSCHGNISTVLLPATTVVLIHQACCRIKNNLDDVEVVVGHYSIISVFLIIGKKNVPLGIFDDNYRCEYYRG